MKEIEVKILNIDPVKIRKLLKKHKAKVVKKVFQKNYGYSTPDSLKQGLAVRIRDEGKKKKIFTVKSNKRIIDGHKIRTEYEIEVKDIKTLDSMLKVLGYKITQYHELKREYYKLHNCSVEIIKFPKKPHYLEIEGDESNIEKVANLLGYSKKDYCAKSVFEALNAKGNVFKFSS